MSLYREAGSRRGRTAAVLSAVLAAGALVGFAAGWASRPQPTLADRVADVQDDVRPALDALELVPLHYGSQNAVTRRAARAQLDAARDDVLGVRDELAALDPGSDARLAHDFDELERLLEAEAPTDRVDAAVRDLERRLRETARID